MRSKQPYGARTVPEQHIPLAEQTPVRMKGDTRVGKVLGAVRFTTGKPRVVVVYQRTDVEGREYVSIPVADLEVANG